MSPKEDVSSERIEQIHQAALTCFLLKGYHRATMDDIVAESGLSKGTLYWYFDSKKALFLSLLESMMGQVQSGWETILADPAARPKEKLRNSLAFFQDELDDLVPFFGFVMEAWALNRLDEDVQSIYRGFYGPYLKLMTQIIEEGIAAGEFRVKDPDATALIMITLYDGLMMAIGAGMVNRDWQSLMAAAEGLVFHGLGVEVGGEG